LPKPTDHGPAEDVIAEKLADAARRADAAIDRFALHEALAATNELVGAVNVYVTEQEPWKVAKSDADSDRARLATILYTAAEALRAIAVLHNAVMPKASGALWESLGAAEQLGALAEQRVQDAGTWGQLPPGATVTKTAALFPRLPEEPAGS
ncbi:MAG: class I tRNA ligase family protein, partial [Streptosporangiales bacterium]|nr:class I tRNA ligase family protein [Streptosporangiales bacterium]